MSGYCLDSWAILGWLEGAEPAASRVEAVLPSRPVMSWLNVGEVFYVTARAVGERAARDIVGDLRATLVLDQLSPDRVLEAASIKAAHAITFGDAFAIATALAHEAVLLTGDPEILQAPGRWTVEDLR